MTTSIDDVCDLFTSKIVDYRLTTLYQTSGSGSLNLFLQPFLLDAIDEFDLCDQDLIYSTTTQTFSVDLTQKNKNMLSLIMVKYYLARELRDINQMRLHLQDRDFRSFAESNGLRAKLELYNQTQEEISQRLVSYGYRNWVTWSDWKNQDFD